MIMLLQLFVVDLCEMCINLDYKISFKEIDYLLIVIAQKPWNRHRFSHINFRSSKIDV